MTDWSPAHCAAEIVELLAEVDAGLLALERAPGDRALINAVFRAAHTVKGSAGLLAQPDLTRLTHAAEDLLDAVRDGRLSVTDDLVDSLLAVFDTIREWLPTIAATDTVPDSAPAVADWLCSHLQQYLPTPGGAAAASGPLLADFSSTQLDTGHLLRQVLVSQRHAALALTAPGVDPSPAQLQAVLDVGRRAAASLGPQRGPVDVELPFDGGPQDARALLAWLDSLLALVGVAEQPST